MFSPDIIIHFYSVVTFKSYLIICQFCEEFASFLFLCNFTSEYCLLMTPCFCFIEFIFLGFFFFFFGIPNKCFTQYSYVLCRKKFQLCFDFKFLGNCAFLLWLKYFLKYMYMSIYMWNIYIYVYEICTYIYTHINIFVYLSLKSGKTDRQYTSIHVCIFSSLNCIFKPWENLHPDLSMIWKSRFMVSSPMFVAQGIIVLCGIFFSF